MSDFSAASTDVVYVMCIVCVVYLGAHTQFACVRKPHLAAPAVLFCFPAEEKDNERRLGSLCHIQESDWLREWKNTQKKITYMWGFSYTSRRLHNPGSPSSAPAQLIRLDNTCRTRAGPACVGDHHLLLTDFIARLQ